MRWQGTCEWLRGRASWAERWWQQSLAAAEKLGARYDLGMTHLEIGKRTTEHGHLESAEVIFAELGAKLDLVEARRALKGESP